MKADLSTDASRWRSKPPQSAANRVEVLTEEGHEGFASCSEDGWELYGDLVGQTVKSWRPRRSHLVPIGEGEFPVLARDLHKALGVKKKYADWWKTLLGRSLDWLFASPSGEANGSGGHNRVDHVLSLDAAKKIAMMAKTAKGDEVRDYFLRCERQLHEVIAPPQSPAEIIAAGWLLLEAQVAEERTARLLAEEHRDLANAGKLLAENVAEERRPAQEWAEDVSAGEGLVETRVALIQASVPGSVRLTKVMWADLDGWFFTYNPGVKPRKRRWRSSWRALGLGEDVPSTVGRGRNRKQVITPKWTPKGVAHLREWLIERQRQATL